MSAGLMIEVVKYAPKSLTAVEWKALMVLADDANDKTRVVFTDIENQKFLDEMDVEANRWRSIRAALKRKGVIVQESAGFKGHRAKFRIVPLRPAEEPEPKERENDAPFESKDARNPTQRSADPAPQTEPKARGNEAQRRADSTRPTPPTPQNQEHSSEPPPPATAPPDWFAAESEGVVVQEEGEGNKQDARKRAEDFVEGLPFLNPPGRGRKQRLQTQVAHAFAAGWSEDVLMAICEEGLNTADDRVNCWLYRLKPAVLGPAPKAGQDDLQSKPMVPKPRQPVNRHRTWQDPDSSTYRYPKREHIGFQNPTDPDAYEGTF